MIRLDPCPCPSETSPAPARGQRSQCRTLLLGAVLALLAAARLAHADVLTPAPANSTPVVPGSYQLAQAFLDDLREGRMEAAFARMESRYRDIATVADFKKSVDEIKAAYGQFVSFQYKTRFDGNRIYPDHFVKPMSKYWFAARTTGRESGVYSWVEVVPDSGEPSVASFSFVTFPNKLPDELK